MALAVDWVDNRDGSGATAWVSGSAGGLVSLYTQPVDGRTTPLGWAAAGSRTGNGSVAVAIDPGYYFGHGVEGAAVSPVSYLAATDGAWAPPTRCRAAVHARLNLLTFAGIPGSMSGIDGRIYEQFLPDPTKVEFFPCITLTTERVQETELRGTNAKDDKGYPVVVAIHDRAHPLDQQRLPYYEKWRWLIERAFDNQPLPGVAESLWCVIEPYQIVDRELPQYQYFVSGLVVRCYTRLARGLLT